MIAIIDFVDKSKSVYGFSIDKKKTASKLRELADKIEHSITYMSEPSPKPDFILQMVSVKAEAQIDDYCMTELTLRIAEKLFDSPVRDL